MLTIDSYRIVANFMQASVFFPEIYYFKLLKSARMEATYPVLSLDSKPNFVVMQ